MDPDFATKLNEFVRSFRTRLKDVMLRSQKHANRRTIWTAVVVAIIATSSYLYLIRPPDSFPAGQLVTVPSGESVASIAAVLEEQGVIRSPLMFRVLVALMGTGHSLHAGDYLFKQPADVFAIAESVSAGHFGLEPFHIRIPEGATVKQMADLYATVLPRFNKQHFLAEAQSLEGYLFPDTYYFLPNATEDTIVAAMKQNFDTHEATIDPQVKTSGKPLDQVVIMASILEREAFNTQDRRLIAGVLWRRIRIGMPLQADATFAYTLGKGSAQLTIADLKSASPYNTYTHTGLPPTPIGSPSLDSLQAAVTPIDKGYLYYLADHQGVTHYSKTYAGQLANERLYLGH